MNLPKKFQHKDSIISTIYKKSEQTESIEINTTINYKCPIGHAIKVNNTKTRNQYFKCTVDSTNTKMVQEKNGTNDCQILNCSIPILKTNRFYLNKEKIDIKYSNRGNRLINTSQSYETVAYFKCKDNFVFENQHEYAKSKCSHISDGVMEQKPELKRINCDYRRCKDLKYNTSNQIFSYTNDRRNLSMAIIKCKKNFRFINKNLKTSYSLYCSKSKSSKELIQNSTIIYLCEEIQCSYNSSFYSIGDSITINCPKGSGFNFKTYYASFKKLTCILNETDSTSAYFDDLNNLQCEKFKCTSINNFNNYDHPKINYISDLNLFIGIFANYTCNDSNSQKVREENKIYSSQCILKNESNKIFTSQNPDLTCLDNTICKNKPQICSADNYQKDDEYKNECHGLTNKSYFCECGLGRIKLNQRNRTSKCIAGFQGNITMQFKLDPNMNITKLQNILREKLNARIAILVMHEYNVSGKEQVNQTKIHIKVLSSVSTNNQQIARMAKRAWLLHVNEEHMKTIFIAAGFQDDPQIFWEYLIWYLVEIIGPFAFFTILLGFILVLIWIFYLCHKKFGIHAKDVCNHKRNKKNRKLRWNSTTKPKKKRRIRNKNKKSKNFMKMRKRRNKKNKSSENSSKSSSGNESVMIFVLKDD